MLQLKHILHFLGSMISLVMVVFLHQNGTLKLFIWTIWNTYAQFWTNACLHCLGILKWDHSFKLPKYMMRLEGTQMFMALFTIVNEWEQIHYQAFVPTKSLAH